MKCWICGFEDPNAGDTCMGCGTPYPRVPVNTCRKRVQGAVQDGMFLAVCVLMSVSVTLKLLASFSLDIIHILVTVFLWLTYAQGRERMDDGRYLKGISGSVFAQYVLTFFTAALVALMGSLLSVALAALGGNTAQGNLLLDMLGDNVLGGLAQVIMGAAGGALMVVTAVGSVGIVVVNLFSVRYIHKFVQSVYRSVDNGVLELKHTRAAKVWLFVFGGIYALSGVVALIGLHVAAMVCDFTMAAAAILGGLLINKHFPE